MAASDLRQHSVHEIHANGDHPGRPVAVKRYGSGTGLRSGITLNWEHLLQLHYAKTLDCWLEALKANPDRAIAVLPEVRARMVGAPSSVKIAG